MENVSPTKSRSYNFESQDRDQNRTKQWPLS